MSLLYAYNSGKNESVLKKLETPMKMLIEAESDYQRTKVGPLAALFNIEKSNRYCETINVRNEFATFTSPVEGEAAERDTTYDSTAKCIEHIPFMKEFVITKQMIDDSAVGLAVDAKRRAQAFVRAYYLTMNKLAEAAIINGKETEIEFNKAIVDLATADGQPLFSKYHLTGSAPAGPVLQSNFFGMNRYKNGHKALTLDNVAEAITQGAIKIRNMKDETGEILGYVADTVVIPGNMPVLEKYVKQILGSPVDPLSANNSINVNYGQWNLIVLPGWQYTLSENPDEQTFPIIIMSSEANRNLCGNMFFNRVPLSIKNWEDAHTRNWIWNGYCRFGIGFGNFKHIALIELYSSSEEGEQTQI